MCEELNQGNSRKKTYAIDVILRQEVVRSGVTDFFFFDKDAFHILQTRYFLQDILPFLLDYVHHV